MRIDDASLFQSAINILRVLRVAELPTEPSEGTAWLVEDLWGREAVGLIGGAPKSCKTFLALEIALAVASGTPCLGRFRVHEPGPVLLFAAEDAPEHVRDRIRGLARARGVAFEKLPIFLILAEEIRLDVDRDRIGLAAAVAEHRPRLLILDPFVRVHRMNENHAAEVSPLLAELRALQRRFGCSVLLVHHTRKGSGPVAGHALRGSSDLHAWGDSNLYVKKVEHNVRLSVEHRTARAPEPITLSLQSDPPRLEIVASASTPHDVEPTDQVLRALRRHAAPMTQAQLRAKLKVRNQTLTIALRDLHARKKIMRTNDGWKLPPQARATATQSPDLFLEPRSVPDPT
jgi:hypothetical protein